MVEGGAHFCGGEGGVEGVVVEEGGQVGVGELGDEVGEDDGADAGAVGLLDEPHAPDGVDVVYGVDEETYIQVPDGTPLASLGGAIPFACFAAL